MFCPNCGTQSPDDLKYCRSCGTDIGIVSQALTGALALPASSRPSKAERRRARKGAAQGEPRLDRAVSHAFMGLAFLLVSIGVFVFAPAGQLWFFWMLIPAFSLLGQAAGEFIRWKQLESTAPRGVEPVEPAAPYLPGMQSSAAPRAIEPPPSFERMTPPSVTEDTTRHLDARAPRPDAARDTAER